MYNTVKFSTWVRGNEKKKEKKKRIHNHIRVAPTFFWSLYLKAIFEIARKALAL